MERNSSGVMIIDHYLVAHTKNALIIALHGISKLLFYIYFHILNFIHFKNSSYDRD